MNALVSAWERILRRRGGDRALVHASDGTSRTFRELEAGAAALGFDPRLLAGRAVVFAVPNGSRWLELFLALQRAGAVAVPLDPAEPVAAQQRIAEALRAGFRWDGQNLIALAGARRFRDPATCLIKLTSGTTGAPRPLVFTAAQMLADARQVTTTMGIRASDLNYALIPFGHSYGLGNLSLPLIAHGVPLVCGAAPLPQAIAEDFVRWRPTVFPSVPAVFRALAAAEMARETLASLRLAISAGAPLPSETARAFAEKFGRRLHAFYGSSETGGIAYDRTGVATLAGGVGTAMRDVRIQMRRGQRLRVCSAAVFTQGNAARSQGRGCWSPPDLATLDARGRITLIGRRGMMVKIGGRRVNLGEVAARLRRIAGVRDAWVAVSAESDPVLGAAVVTVRSPAEIRAELLHDTVAWKIPKRWAVLGELPLTARGKTDTRALHARVFGATTSAPLQLPPEDRSGTGQPAGR